MFFCTGGRLQGHESVWRHAASTCWDVTVALQSVRLNCVTQLARDVTESRDSWSWRKSLSPPSLQTPVHRRNRSAAMFSRCVTSPMFTQPHAVVPRQCLGLECRFLWLAWNSTLLSVYDGVSVLCCLADCDERFRLVYELAESERLYQEDLRSVFDLYAEPLRSEVK